MVTFVSTFPPIMCGIGTYTSYLVSSMPAETWRVMSFRPDEFFRTEHAGGLSDRVSYVLSSAVEDEGGHPVDRQSYLVQYDRRVLPLWEGPIRFSADRVSLSHRPAVRDRLTDGCLTLS